MLNSCCLERIAEDVVAPSGIVGLFLVVVVVLLLVAVAVAIVMVSGEDQVVVAESRGLGLSGCNS